LYPARSKNWIRKVQNLHPNNNNLNSTNITTTNREKDVVVNFKKLKEEGDLSACNAQAEEKMLAIREQLKDLDFEGKFIEQILKEYSPKKIEKKLDLLMERSNIQSPAGWLMAALKNDYQDGQQEDIPIQNSSKNISPPGTGFSRKSSEGNQADSKNLSACLSPLPSGKSTRVRENRKP